MGYYHFPDFILHCDANDISITMYADQSELGHDWQDQKEMH